MVPVVKPVALVSEDNMPLIQFQEEKEIPWLTLPHAKQKKAQPYSFGLGK